MLLKPNIFKAFNAIFSKFGRSASKEVVINLSSSKCLPVLLYATDACSILSRDKHSLEFVATRSFMKVFRTGSINVVNGCQKYFDFLPTGRSSLVVTRLPAARKDPGSHRAVGKSLCFHENHCDTQLWARAAH